MSWCGRDAQTAPVGLGHLGWDGQGNLRAWKLDPTGTRGHSATSRSRELTLVASFSLWLGSGAVAEEGRDLGLGAMKKDPPPCPEGVPTPIQPASESRGPPLHFQAVFAPSPPPTTGLTQPQAPPCFGPLLSPGGHWTFVTLGASARSWRPTAGLRPWGFNQQEAPAGQGVGQRAEWLLACPPAPALS